MIYLAGLTIQNNSERYIPIGLVHEIQILPPHLHKPISPVNVSREHRNSPLYIVYLQEGLVPYNIDLTVSGDIAIAIWFGSYNLGQRIQTQPALTYCFHTSFVDATLERVNVNQLDVVDGALFPAQAARNFFMDITLEEASSDGPQDAESEDMDMPGDVHWMRSKWRDTVTKMYGTDSNMQVQAVICKKRLACKMLMQGIVACFSEE